MNVSIACARASFEGLVPGGKAGVLDAAPDAAVDAAPDAVRFFPRFLRLVTRLQELFAFPLAFDLPLDFAFLVGAGVEDGTRMKVVPSGAV